MDFHASDNDNKEFKVKALCNGIVYIRKSKPGSSTKALLSGALKRLRKRRKYLRVSSSCLAPWEAHQLVP